MSEGSEGAGNTGPSTRGQGRELALAVMCALESTDADDEAARAETIALVLQRPPQGDEAGESAFAELVASPAGRRFAETLLGLWTPRRAEIDALIEKVSRRWRLSRMDHVDRNVVRLAAAELAGLSDTPRGVVIAEAVRLARRYGTDKSAPFVNGLVESLAKELRPD